MAVGEPSRSSKRRRLGSHGSWWKRTDATSERFPSAGRGTARGVGLGGGRLVVAPAPAPHERFDKARGGGGNVRLTSSQAGQSEATAGPDVRACGRD